MKVVEELKLAADGVKVLHKEGKDSQSLKRRDR